MAVIPDDEIRRALVVTAHPDDVDFGAAATVAAWTSAGIAVTYCVITDGQAGGFDPGLDRAEMPRIRRGEQTAAAGHVGVKDLVFLGYVDGELFVTRELIRDITRVIRQARPERILIQSPERNWKRLAPSHPDHLTGGEAATRAVWPAAGNPFAFEELLRDEGLDAWSPRELWIMEHPTANHVVDVTDHFDAKIAALMSHESQHPDPARIRQLMHDKLTATGVEYSLGEGRLGEKFAVHPLP
ncbi:MAG TPA: PIG-L deacetylase family protein [Nocardioidaceae bacterium]|nr:PIG-L deacetylase family protein [Nocardioidaceae bacterium]